MGRATDKKETRDSIPAEQRFESVMETHRLNDKPVAMVWPKKDPAFGKRKYLDRWLGYFPTATVEELEDASHYVQEDRPERIVEAIRDVLRRRVAS